MTGKRIRQNEDELTGDLLAGEFRAGSLSGTESVNYYHMQITPDDVPGEGLAMTFMDFPGRLLTPSERATRAAEWAEILAFTRVSTALLIPIDAVVLMEARTKDQHRAIPRLLGLGDVRTVAETWATSRNTRRGEPATVIFCPVKCESYFTDQGGRGRDRSHELARRMQEVYANVVDTIHREAGHAQLLYAPIDSIGCVELVDPHWTLIDGGKILEPDPEFLVRPPGRRSVVGAKDVLIPLVSQAVNAARQSAENLEKAARAEQERRTEVNGLTFWDAASRFGFWTEVRDRMDGATKRRKTLKEGATVEAAAALRTLDAYDNVLAGISNRSYGPRVRTL
ncbi:hypothetical protein MXD61_08295 [Frankia sp. AgPm24]|uniref:hypothetical protein n=1 Tax=Frankia sp. AgPm24 TaxID=631128 RepID=UPI00200F4E5B|nr:hypothetical protein [Frankia sp. AgPm24]MCK9921883.1 hypothetical protein [Frankia sp. AgPm24]